MCVRRIALRYVGNAGHARARSGSATAHVKQSVVAQDAVALGIEGAARLAVYQLMGKRSAPPPRVVTRSYRAGETVKAIGPG